MYSVQFSLTAEKQLRKINPEARERILSVLDRIKIRPYHHVKKLVGSPYFRARAGEYRIILDIRDRMLIIFVIEVGHRSNIYRE